MSQRSRLDLPARITRDRCPLPLNALRAFEAVARHGGAHAAARALQKSQSPLTRHVLTLERFIGTPLYERWQRSLTPEGEELFRVLAPCFDRLQQSLKRLRKERFSLAGAKSIRGEPTGRSSADAQARITLERRLLPLNALRALEAVAQHGGFHAAARALGVPQSPLSYQVRVLERAIGSPLCQRAQLLLRREHALTPAGEELFTVVTDCFEKLQETVEGIRLRRAGPEHTNGA